MAPRDAQPRKFQPHLKYSEGKKAKPIWPLSDYRVCMKRRPHRSDLQKLSQLLVLLTKITNLISFARIKNAPDQFRVENRPYLKLNLILGLLFNRSWYKALEVSYGLFFPFFWRHLWMGGHNFFVDICNLYLSCWN